MTTVLPTSVTVYNADYRALREVPWQKAVAMILRETVFVLERHSPAVHIRSPKTTIELPAAIALRKYAPVPYLRPVASREAVLRRDKHSCAYCGGKATTIDHVLPRSRGGADVWINLVAACGPCNTRKRDRLPHEAGMMLRWEPFEPEDKDSYYIPTA